MSYRPYKRTYSNYSGSSGNSYYPNKRYYNNNNNKNYSSSYSSSYRSPYNYRKKNRYTPSNKPSPYTSPSEQSRFTRNVSNLYKNPARRNNVYNNIRKGKELLYQLKKKNKITFEQNRGNYRTRNVPKVTGYNTLGRSTKYDRSYMNNKNKKTPYNLLPDKKRKKVKFSLYNPYTKSLETKFNTLSFTDREFASLLNEGTSGIVRDVTNLFSSFEKSLKATNNKYLNSLTSQNLSAGTIDTILNSYNNTTDNDQYNKLSGLCNIKSVLSSLLYGGKIPEQLLNVQFYYNTQLFKIIHDAGANSLLNETQYLSIMLNLGISFAAALKSAEDTPENRLLLQNVKENMGIMMNQFKRIIQRRDPCCIHGNVKIENASYMDIDGLSNNNSISETNSKDAGTIGYFNPTEENMLMSGSLSNDNGSLESVFSSPNPFTSGSGTNVVSNSTRALKNEIMNYPMPNPVSPLDPSNALCSVSEIDSSNNVYLASPQNNFTNVESLFNNTTNGNNLSQAPTQLPPQNNIAYFGSYSRYPKDMPIKSMSTSYEENVQVGSKRKCITQPTKNELLRIIYPNKSNDENTRGSASVVCSVLLNTNTGVPISNSYNNPIQYGNMQPIAYAINNPVADTMGIIPNSISTFSIQKPLEQMSKEEEFMLLQQLVYIYQASINQTENTYTFNNSLATAFKDLLKRKSIVTNNLKSTKLSYRHLLSTVLLDLNQKIESERNFNEVTKTIQFSSVGDLQQIVDSMKGLKYNKELVANLENIIEAIAQQKGDGNEFALQIGLEGSFANAMETKKEIAFMKNVSAILASISPLEGTQLHTDIKKMLSA